jgi:PKD repeat protein
MNKIRILLLLAVLSLGVVSAVSYLRPAIAANGKYFDHSVTILMENNDLQSVLSQGTYQASLSSQYTLATGYSAVSHPSEPNYVALIGGSTNGINNDGICCFTVSAPNLIDRFESAGLTWKSFAEDASGSGTCSFSPPRGGDHFPFLDYADINTAARCANFASTSSSGDSEFVSYLNSASPANYIWLTPNDNDNSHDTPISTGDAYLAALVPQILASNLFKTQRAALFIVYDEGNDVSCSSGGSDCVYASWSGPVTKTGFTSSNAYTHYSYVHTMEDNWGLSTLASNDANAPVMSEFFGPSGPVPLSTGFTITPSTAHPGQTLTFAASPSGGTSPYSETWNFGDGSSGSGATANHSYSNAGTFQVSLTTQDSASPANTATTTKSLVISTPPPPGKPSVSISSNPTSATTGQNIAFTSTVTGGTPPYGIGWDFGDGSIAVGSSTTHAFSMPGTFNVTAAVTDSATPAQSSVASIFITVTQAPPPPTSLAADFTFTPSAPDTGVSVSFASTVSGGSLQYTYQWDFGDSSGTSTAANPTYTYTSAGTYTITLNVTDSASTSKIISHTITINALTTTPPPPPTSNSSGSFCTGLTPQGLQPIVSVDYSNGGAANLTSTALFDTGANYSLAPASLATALGLKLTDGVPVTITDLGGPSFQAYLFNLNLEIGGTLQVVNVPVAISNSATQFIIGRQGFLTQVSVTIDSSAQTVCFTANTPSSSCDTEASTCGGTPDGDGDGDNDHMGQTGSQSEDSGDNDESGDTGDASADLFAGSSGTVSGLPVVLTIVPLIALAALVSKGLFSRVVSRKK